MKRSAVAKGLITEDIAAGMSEREALNLIFRAGFSTAAKVTDLSGRGVGMDVVRDNVESLKGSLEILSRVGQGTTMQIKLPLTLAIIQVLLVRSAGETFAIPISAIEENLLIPRQGIQRVGTREVLEMRGQTLALMRLEEVLELSPPPGEAGRAGVGSEAPIPAIVVRMMGIRLAIAVDAFVKKQEVVIKNLGNLLRKVRFAAGSTILGDGRVVLILDVPEIVKSAGVERERLRPVAAGAAAVRGRKILVVEDSNVVRRRIKEILEVEGHLVTEAVDGKDGLTRARQETFDLVTVDIMMPRMDGYELTERLRALPEYKTTPIVMISSRTDEVDKKRGFEAGVDDYITKPFAQDRLAACIGKYLR
jgi:two-component system chemotaxis sensor kinase CheA